MSGGYNILSNGAVRTRLRAETQVWHDRVEELFDLPRQLRTTEDYRRVLADLLGFHAPMEAAVGRIDWTDVPLDLARRCRTPLVERDLRALGLSQAVIDALPRCSRLPQPTDRAAALGCLYVLEGSTLGGQVVRRHVQAALGPEVAGATAFFGSHGPAVGVLWRDFLVLLEKECATEAAIRSAAAAATRSFACLADWLSRPRS